MQNITKHWCCTFYFRLISSNGNRIWSMGVQFPNSHPSHLWEPTKTPTNPPPPHFTKSFTPTKNVQLQPVCQCGCAPTTTNSGSTKYIQLNPHWCTFKQNRVGYTPYIPLDITFWICGAYVSSLHLTSQTCRSIHKVKLPTIQSAMI